MESPRENYENVNEEMGKAEKSAK
uniref:Uncharacterized protein n=1 Tax=Rhizophora mucronata TaxID=61149 RepID=A0A2P2QH96_RHIMU